MEFDVRVSFVGFNHEEHDRNPDPTQQPQKEREVPHAKPRTKQGYYYQELSEDPSCITRRTYDVVRDSARGSRLTRRWLIPTTIWLLLVGRWSLAALISRRSLVPGLGLIARGVAPDTQAAGLRKTAAGSDPAPLHKRAEAEHRPAAGVRLALHRPVVDYTAAEPLPVRFHKLVEPHTPAAAVRPVRFDKGPAAGRLILPGKRLVRQGGERWVRLLL